MVMIPACSSLGSGFLHEGFGLLSWKKVIQEGWVATSSG